MKKFNVGIVGYGWAATAHIPAINAGTLGRVTRICSSRPLDSRQLSEAHGCDLQVHNSYSAMLAEPDLDVVSVCSYLHTHIVGSEGSLLDNRFHSNLLHGDDRHRWKELPYKPVDSGDVSDHPYRTQFEAFFHALAKGEDMPLTGLKEAVRTHEVIFAAELSLEQGRPVRMEEIHAR